MYNPLGGLSGPHGELKHTLARTGAWQPDDDDESAFSTKLERKEQIWKIGPLDWTMGAIYLRLAIFQLQSSLKEAECLSCW